MMRKKTSKSKRKQQRKKQIIINNSYQIVRTIILIISILAFTYVIFETNLLSPQIDKKTASYISFNNKNTTDMMKITNLKKMSNKKGMSVINPNYLEIEVDGNKKSKYEVVVYPITNNIDLGYVHFVLQDKDRIIKKGLLSEGKDSSDEGKIIYQGKIDKKKFVLKMWVGEEYKDKIQDNSFEVRIKPG